MDLRQLSVFRKYERGSYVRAGRFLPLELPSVGYLDGGQADVAINDHLRFGGMLGLKPDRYDLDFSADEPTGVAYASVQAGEVRKLYYSGTLGMLGSLYRGEADRVAMLLDQRAALSRHLHLYSSTELDMDAGGAEVREGLTLTRWNLHAHAPINQVLSFRAGAAHYQLPDTAAERAARSIPSPELFDRGYWRYTLGSSQQAPWNLTFDEEVSFLEGVDYDLTPLWRLGVSRRGIFSLRDSRISLMVYNLESRTVRGYGSRLYAYFALLQSRLSFQPSLGFRVFDEDLSGEKLDLTDASLLANWLISQRWSAHAHASHTFGTSVQATFLDLGLTYRW